MGRHDDWPRVEAVSEFGSTQVIRVGSMPLDEQFATLVGMIFGRRDPARSRLCTLRRGT